jgi:hypothetical protein
LLDRGLLLPLSGESVREVLDREQRAWLKV